MANNNENQVEKSSIRKLQILIVLHVQQSGRRRRIRTDDLTNTMDIGGKNKWQIQSFGLRKTSGQCSHHSSGKQKSKTSGKKRGSQVANQMADFSRKSVLNKKCTFNISYYSSMIMQKKSYYKTTIRRK